jgi:hypothetical protein
MIEVPFWIDLTFGLACVGVIIGVPALLPWILVWRAMRRASEIPPDLLGKLRNSMRNAESLALQGQLQDGLVCLTSFRRHFGSREDLEGLAEAALAKQWRQCISDYCQRFGCSPATEITPAVEELGGGEISAAERGP